MTARLEVVPMSLRAANTFVGQEHRHHPPTRGHKFSVGVRSEGVLVGVAIAGRPVARALDAQGYLEVVRVATNGHPNACSALYGTVARAGVALGYPRTRIVTYTLQSEPGTSLRAAGWVPVRTTQADTWDTPARRRTQVAPATPKVRWHASAPGVAA